MKRIFLLLFVLVSLHAADAVTVDVAGTVVVGGATPATPASGEVRLGASQVPAQGTVTAADVVVNGTTLPGTNTTSLYGEHVVAKVSTGMAQTGVVTIRPPQGLPFHPVNQSTPEETSDRVRA